MLAAEHVRGNSMLVSRQRECRALYAMAYGFFGRSTAILPHDDFFDRITELFEAVSGC